MLRSRLDRAFLRWRRTGDGRSLARVFDGIAPELYRLGYHLLGDRHGAEDLVQHTFVVAIEKAATFDAARGVVPWLCGILTHHALHVRRQQRQRAGKESGVADAIDPAAQAAADELRATVVARVRALPEPYRLVLLLHLVHELTPQEVAEALARPDNTVRTQLARGLDLLRKALPAGIGGLASACMPAPLGLATVRAAVLQRAAELVGTNTALATVGAVAAPLLGGLLMKKSMLVVLAAIVLWSTWAWWQGASLAPPEEPIASGRSNAPPATAYVPAAGLEPVPVIASGDARTDASATASLEVVVSWSDGTPAVDLAVRVTPLRQEGSLWLSVERTGADGIARFPAQDPGKVHVRTGRGNAAEVELAVGKPQTVQLTIPRGVDVRGRVVDSDEKAVAGASVWLSVVANSDENALAAVSGPDGSFRLRSVGAFHVISATAPGYGCSKSAFVPRDEANEELVVVVRRVPGVLVGTVVDERNRPVANARVVVGLAGHGHDMEPEYQRFHGEVRGVDAWPARFGSGDGEGRFRVDGLPPWRWPVCVGAPGFGPLVQVVEVAADRETCVTFVLAGPATVTGVVRGANGEPAADVQIHAGGRPLADIDKRITLGAPWLAPRWVATTARTDADGHYTIKGVLPGTLQLSGWRGRDHARADRSIAAGEVLDWSPTLASDDRLQITGSLVDEAGAPVTGFLLCVDDAARGRRTFGLLADGSFRFERTDDVPFRIAVKRRPPNAGRLIPLGEFRRADCPLRLVVPAAARRSATLRGRLLGEHGSPLATGYVRAFSRDRRWSAAAQPDAAGNFVTGEVDAGPCEVRVEDTPFGSYGIGAVELKTGECEDLGDVKPPPTGQLVVTVVDRSDRRLPDVWVRTTPLGGDRMAGWEAKHHESVTRGALPAGRYSLQTLDGLIASMEVDVVAGQTTDVRFVVPDAVPFVLRLPVASGDIDQLRHQWRIDGRLVLSDSSDLRAQPYDERHSAPEGRYTVEVRDPDGNLATATFDLRASEPAPVFELPFPHR